MPAEKVVEISNGLAYGRDGSSGNDGSQNDVECAIFHCTPPQGASLNIITVLLPSEMEATTRERLTSEIQEISDDYCQNALLSLNRTHFEQNPDKIITDFATTIPIGEEETSDCRDRCEGILLAEDSISRIQINVVKREEFGELFPEILQWLSPEIKDSDDYPQRS